MILENGLGRRSRREWLAQALVLLGLFVFIVLAYAVIVVGGGAVIGHASSPQLGLSVLATAVVALAFDPVQTHLEELASRTVHGGQPSPYDVLRRFSGTLTGSYAAEELPSRMARVLADGTGAEWSQVWVVVGSRPVLAASWPPDDARGPGFEDADPQDASVPGRHSLPVRHGAELLGVLVVQERPGVSLTSVERRLFAGLAGQAGLVLRGTRLRAELELRVRKLSLRAEELRLSRQRLVDAQDDGRRLLERDIHDGAQQHLVALAVNLRLADTLASRSPERALELLSAQEAAADDAVATLVQLSRGIYPPLLEDEGVAAALRAVASGAAQSVEVVDHDLGRYAVGIEAAAYFTCLEALQNAAKHSGADRVRIELRGEPGALTLTVSDDGHGFDPDRTTLGTGLTNMRDRVESVGGALTTRSAPGGGTRIQAAFPAQPAAPADGGV